MVVHNVSFVKMTIKKLNPNKLLGWYNISIRMIKICDKSVSHSLKIIFEVLFQEGIVPDSSFYYKCISYKSSVGFLLGDSCIVENTASSKQIIKKDLKY